MNEILTFLTAASFIFLFTFITLDKKQMAGFIHTIDMCIAWFAALMAFGNDIFGYPFSQPVIKHKILSNEFVFQSFFFYLLCIIDDAAFQMKNIFEIPCVACKRWLFHNGYHRCNT